MEDVLKNMQKTKQIGNTLQFMKEYSVSHFEGLLVLTILITAILSNYLIAQKFVLLNFYYLPVLTAGYFLGRRMALLTSIFCLLAVLFLLAADLETFSNGMDKINIFAFVAVWGGFLILTSVMVGTLYEHNQIRILELKYAYIGILEILSKYLEDTDRYTKGHSIRVSGFAMDIAIAMELPREEVENIRVGALLHDIGKIEISGNLIRKAASLSNEDRTLMDSHTERGVDILKSVGNVLKGAMPIVMAHHTYFSEKLDFEEFPLGARIVSVADAFDAMTSDRPYRKGMPPWKAYGELKEGSGKQFDPSVVEAFGRVLESNGDNV